MRSTGDYTAPESTRESFFVAFFPRRSFVRLFFLLALVLTVTGAGNPSGLVTGPPGAAAGLEAVPATVVDRVLPGPEPVPWTGPGPSGTGPEVAVTGSGWGHSVGMSQYGAHAMGKAGHDYREILAHYYPGVVPTSDGVGNGEIRIGLFRHRGDVDQHDVQIAATGSPVAVTLGDHTVAVPRTAPWRLRADGPALVLLNASGSVVSRGASPARVTFGGAGHGLLRLPQLGTSYRWGRLEVTTGAEGRLLPTLVTDLEAYLRGIAEMPGSWSAEALKAQAITARTFAVRQQRDGLKEDCACHLGTTPHDQAYRGYTQEAQAPRWVQAVTTTRGEVATYKGELAWTYYSSSHGGRTEHSEDSWAYGEAHPYLRSVDDPWSADPANKMRAWQRPLGNQALAEVIGPHVREVRGVRILERTEGGSPRTLAVRILDRDGSDRWIRWSGEDGVAASAVKLGFRSHLPSQQLRTMGLEPFRDDDGHRYEWEISTVAGRGLMAGCAPGRFCPDEAVRLRDAQVFLERLTNAPAAGCEGAGCDAPIDRAALRDLIRERPGVAGSHAAWVIADCSFAGSCAPGPVNRATMAVALDRLPHVTG